MTPLPRKSHKTRDFLFKSLPIPVTRTGADKCGQQRLTADGGQPLPARPVEFDVNGTQYPQNPTQPLLRQDHMLYKVLILLVGEAGIEPVTVSLEG
jgi:hypothetical protein